MLDVLYAGHQTDATFSRVGNALRHSAEIVPNTYPTTVTYGISNVSIGSMNKQRMSGAIPQIYITVDCAMLRFEDEAGTNVQVVTTNEDGSKVDDTERNPTIGVQYNVDESELKQMIDGGFYANPKVYEQRLNKALKQFSFTKQTMVTVNSYFTDENGMAPALRLVEEESKLEVSNRDDYESGFTGLYHTALHQLIEQRERDLAADMTMEFVPTDDTIKSVEIHEELMLDGSEKIYKDAITQTVLQQTKGQSESEVQSEIDREIAAIDEAERREQLEHAKAMGHEENVVYIGQNEELTFDGLDTPKVEIKQVDKKMSTDVDDVKIDGSTDSKMSDIVNNRKISVRESRQQAAQQIQRASMEEFKKKQQRRDNEVVQSQQEIEEKPRTRKKPKDTGLEF